MAIATDAQKEEFLAKVRNALASSKMDYNKRKLKNEITIEELGLNYRSIRWYVGNLEVADYDDGPMPHRGLPGADLYWVFTISISGKQIYIRLKVREKIDGRVYVDSFHYDDRTHYWGF